MTNGQFVILASKEEPGAFSLISPDCGTCDACWRDFGDPANRRFGYPFTNCTHCGPRYTIIHDIPYDRATTTMAGFTMCADARRSMPTPMTGASTRSPTPAPSADPRWSWSLPAPRSADCTFADHDSLTIIRKARALLRAGNILAVKGLGGFLLACDAANDAAVAELRRRKRRSDKPFALMARDLPSVRRICAVSAEDEAALLDVRRPIVVLPRLAVAAVSAEVAPGNDTLGMMLPYTPLHYLLFSDSPDAPSEYTALVMTSGNLSEEPIVISNAEALRQLDGVADWFLLHNRDIATRVDDSVVRTFEGRRTRAAALAWLCAADHRPGHRNARGPGLRRRTEEHLLPDQGPLRDPEPAHRRSGELRDHAVLRADAAPASNASSESRREPSPTTCIPATGAPAWR